MNKESEFEPELESIEREREIVHLISPILLVLKKEAEKNSQLKTLEEKIDFTVSKFGLAREEKASPEKVKQLVEVEDKYEVENLDELGNQLKEKGFDLKKESWQAENYLDFGQELRKLDQVVRVRKTFDKNRKFVSGEFKWEGPRGELQDRPVVEIKLETETDCDLILKLLKEKLGFEEFIHFLKYRLPYERYDEGQKIEAEVDSFQAKENPKQIRGKNYVQIALEVEPEGQDQALQKGIAITQSLGLANHDNRDYIEIAQGLKRKELKK